MYKLSTQYIVQNAIACSLLVVISFSVTASVSNKPVLTVPETRLQSIPSISGVIRTFSSNASAVFTESWVVMSPFGMRVSDGSSDSEIIKNFAKQRLWLQDKKAKLRHEINLNALKKDFPELAPVLMGTGTESNLFGMTPCETWVGEHEGERVWRGMVVDVWECKEDSGVLVSRQFFSQLHAIVVRVEHPSSIVEELRNITELQTASSDFQPDKEFKSVSYIEFTSGETPLNQYTEHE